MAGTGVGKFSSTGSNNTANLTVNFAENMAPSNVNNAARELMGHIRDMYEQLGDGYFEFGDGDGTYTVARSDADTITITSASDISSVYFAGRKIRITDGGANVVEGTIASSSHASTTQTVNLTGISLASGTPTKVELGVDTAAFGGRVILDDDGDTYIEAPTDDTIDIYVAGAKDFVITANTFTAESGSTIAAQALTATTITTTGAIAIANDGNIGSAGDADAIAISSSGVVTFSQAPVFPDGSIAVADLDIDGATDIGAAIVDADLFIIDDGAGGTNRKVTASRLKTYAGATAAFTEAVTITVADNSNNLTLTSTDADANSGPNIVLNRDSGSPADNDIVGQFTFRADNDAGEATDYCRFRTHLQDVTNGEEDGNFRLFTIVAGAEVSRINIDKDEICFNEDSVDVDFRVESNGNANMLIVDAGGDAVLVGTATHDGNAAFTAHSSGNGNRPAFIVNGGAVATTTFGTRFKMSVTRDDNTSDLMVAGDNTADRFKVFSDGDVVNHDNSYGAISDSRVKSNIVDANSQWDDIKAVKVRNYKKNDDIAYYADEAWVQIGVIAQELEAAGMDKLVKDETKYLSTDPEVVAGDKNVGDLRGYKSVKYSVLYMKAIKALQEAMTRIETLEAKVTELEG
jgi:hypothetical protein